MNASDLDLNLLVVFRALARARSVSAAARQIGRSQPAVSNALARLRLALGDPLLVRGQGGGMALTPRAEALVPDVEEALARVEQALSVAPFDPATAEATLVVAANDYAEMVLLPRLAAALAHRAPRLRLTIRPTGPEVATDLARGEVDLALGVFRALPASRLRQRLFTERFVCVVRRGHPLVRKRLTLDAFTRLGHVLVSPTGVGGSAFDDRLAEHGVTRRIVVRVPHFLVAPLVVAGTDHVLTLAERVARVFAEPLGLAVFPSPVEPPTFEVAQAWHARTHAGPLHRFVRGLVAEISATA